MKSNHVVLLGDSIFDNGKYVHQDGGARSRSSINCAACCPAGGT